jgi:hypothetical protein
MSGGTSSKKPTRSQLLNEIAALTAFGTSASDHQVEGFDDGTTAIEAVEGSGQWVMDGDDEPIGAPQQRSKLRMAAGMDFEDDDRYKGKRVGRKALTAFTGKSGLATIDWRSGVSGETLCSNELRIYVCACLQHFTMGICLL